MIDHCLDQIEYNEIGVLKMNHNVYFFYLAFPISLYPLNSKITFTLVQNIIERHQLSTLGNKCTTFISSGHNPASPLADNLSHVNKSVLLQ